MLRAIQTRIEYKILLLIAVLIAGFGTYVGIGINTGEMIMGAMGNDARMDFPLIGDHVNLDARLRTAAKPGQILLSEFAAQRLRSLPEFTLRSLDAIVVKGRHPVNVFEVVSTVGLPGQSQPGNGNA